MKTTDDAYAAAYLSGEPCVVGAQLIPCQSSLLCSVSHLNRA